MMLINQPIEDDIDSLLHSYHLRFDFKAEIYLPSDLSDDEAYRLSKLVQGSAYAEESSNDEPRTYQFPIREEMVTTVALPINLTSQEANRFAEFLTTLSFE